ncbi:MAG: ROK family transcriptional regulator [Spirochaetales bacterium]|nr:ROK family transcriptional regulator [Spirochaetales bacterium]
MTDMKLSQPKSARTINTARVLAGLRTTPGLSKADLSRDLDLNKVSTGEIVDELIREGLVRETGKVESSNGRRPTSLALVPDAKYVLSVDIGSRNTTVALCNMLSEPKHFERIPTNTGVKKVEEFIVDIIKSCIRVVRLADQSRIVGAGITIGGVVSSDGRTIVSCPYLPWRNIPIAEAFEQLLKLNAVARNSTYALVDAERYASSGTDLLQSDQPIIYIEWGNSVSMALVCEDRVFGAGNSFAHLKASPTGLCHCGQIGCLEANVSAWALSGNGDMHLKDLWERVDDSTLTAMANAITMARQITGSTKVVISGEGATITDGCLGMLRRKLPDMAIERSNLGEKANMMAAAEVALDKWVYMTTLLEKVKNWL